MRQWIEEVLLMMLQSLKLLIKGKNTIVLLATGVIALSFMLLGMDEVKDEKSRISIGIVNEDSGALSEAVLKGMKQKELYEVFVGEEQELLKRLKRGELAAVCVISETFSEKIREGSTEKLITVYETEDRSALLLGDILAGVMMQEICIGKSYRTLLDYQKKAGYDYTLSREEYEDYVTETGHLTEPDFSFSVQYVKGNENVVEKPSRTVVYEQAVFSVFAMMTGFLALYSVVPFWQICHGKVAKRLKTLPVNRGTVYVGSALAGFCVPMLFGGLFLTGYFLQNTIEFSQIISLLVCTAGYICVIVCMMLLAAMGLKHQTVYHMGMLAMLLIFGVFGMISIVDGLLVPEGTGQWIPNSWYVRKIIDLIQR